MKTFVNTLIVLTILVFSVPSYPWLRDADIANSKDSITIGVGDGMGNYPFLGEKIIDYNTSVGLFYFPTVLGGTFIKNWTEFSYNKQFYQDEKSSWAYYVGFIWWEIRSGLHLSELDIDDRTWKGQIGPTFGWAYSNRFSENWRFRFGTLLILPYRVEVAYEMSKSLELSFGVSMAGLISINVLF